MYIVCKTTGDDICGFYDYAAVSLTSEAAKNMLARRDWIMGIPEGLFPAFYCVEGFDYACAYGNSFAEEGVAEAIDTLEADWGVVDVNPRLVLDFQTAADVCRYTRRGVSWAAQPKHSGGNFETPEIPWEQVEKVAARQCPFQKLKLEAV